MPIAVQSRTKAALRTPVGLSALVVVAALLFLAVVAPWVWGSAAETANVPDMLQGSSADHPFGTDNLGRDMFARTMVATRLSLFLAVIIGVGASAAVLAVGIAGAPTFARLTQTLSASVARSDYVAAARVLGLSRWRVLTRHVVPNIAEPLILNTTVSIGFALLSLSGLSFLGLGVQAPSYDWGRLLDEALDRMYVTPEAALGPCIAILLTGIAFNGLGEALAQAASVRPPRVRRNPAAPGHVPAAEPNTKDVLRVRELTVSFPTGSGVVTPVRGISFSVGAGETVGIVGESASGKSLTALSLSGLVAYPGVVEAQRLEFLGTDVRTMPRAERQRVLGTNLAMVFQDPSTSLNPALRMGTQLAEVAQVHEQMSRRDAMKRAVDRLRAVRMSSPERRVKQYPHELSGGMRQRAMIGIGLMGRPRLIIADEPTSALDVTVQQQILRLLRQVGDDTGSSCLLISHDIAVVAELCDRVLVMYAGRIVEDLGVEALRAGPAHPYTRALLAAVPDMSTDRSQPLATIPGRPPDVGDVPPGCAFAPRCAHATQKCRTELPVLEPVHGSPVRAACWHPQVGPVEPTEQRDGQRAVSGT